MNKRDISKELREKMDQFNVDVPEISLKQSLSQRMVNWLSEPVKSPADFLFRQWTPLKIALFPIAAFVCSIPFAFI